MEHEVAQRLQELTDQVLVVRALLCATVALLGALMGLVAAAISMLRAVLTRQAQQAADVRAAGAFARDERDRREKRCGTCAPPPP